MEQSMVKEHIAIKTKIHIQDGGSSAKRKEKAHTHILLLA